MESTTSNGKIIYHTPDFWESVETNELDKALVAFNSEFHAVKRDETVSMQLKSGGQLKRKFASLDEIMIVVRPILAKNKLYVQQPIVGDRLVTIIKHESGQMRAFAMPMIAWEGTNTNALQNLGGAITYLKRYAISAALALAAEDDDDGNSAGKLDVKKQQPSAAAKTETQQPRLEQHVLEEWQSKVNECKVPEDFTRLSKEIADLKLEKESPLRKFIGAAIGSQMEKVGVEFIEGVYSKKLPTEKQA